MLTFRKLRINAAIPLSREFLTNVSFITSHGQVVGVDGTAATSGNEKPCSRPKINLASSKFADIKETDHFVDKTKFLQVLLDDSPYVLITRPRRCGKSTIMDMVQEFVEKKVYTTGHKVGQEIERSPENDRAFPKMNLRLFEDGNFEIFKWDEFSSHRGKYPTIYLDLVTIHGDNYQNILRQFRAAITQAFEHHSYLLYCKDLWSTEERPDGFDKKQFVEYLHPPKLEDMIVMIASSAKEKTMTVVEDSLLQDIEEALLFLAKVLHKHFDRKIYLLIDEYDAPINNTIFKNKELCEKVNGLLTKVFKNLLKQGGSFIGRALITGISYFSSVGLSGVNNMKKHMFLRGEEGGDDRYEEFYGITEEELEQLTTKFSKTFWQCKNKLPKEKVDSYYNGFKSIGTSGVKIYPTWSIVRALENGNLGHYWEKSGFMEGARQGLDIPIVLFAIEELLSGKHIKCEIPNRLELEHLKELSDVFLKLEDSRTLVAPDLFLSFLLQQGYLTYVTEIEEDIFEIKIPNELLKREFRKLITTHLGSDYDSLIAKVTAVFDKFPDDPDDLSDEIMKELISSMQDVFEYVSRKWNKTNEDAYHSVIFHSLCRSSKYMRCTELRGKKGIIDITFNSKNIVVIIEVKYRQDASKAFEQIKSRKYVEIVRKQLSNEKFKCVCMGLNVDENNKVSIIYSNADKLGNPHEVSL